MKSEEHFLGEKTGVERGGQCSPTTNGKSHSLDTGYMRSVEVDLEHNKS